MWENSVLCEDCGSKEESRPWTGRAGKLNLVGTIWVVVCFLLGSGSVFAVEFAGPLVINYTSGTYQNRLAVQGDCVWIATEGGLVLIKGNTGQRLKFTPADWRGAPGAGSVVVDISGGVWGCPSHQHGYFDPGLFQFDGLAWEWNERPLEGAMYRGLVAAHLASDELGNVWVPLYDRMIRFHGSNWYSWDMAAPSWWAVFDCVAARGGKAWAPSGGGSRLFVFEDDDLSWMTLNESIYDIAADITNGVWLALPGLLLHFDEGHFRGFELPPETGLSDRGFDVRVDDRNTKWCIKSVGYELWVASLSQDETWAAYGEFTVPVQYVQDVRFGEDGEAWLMPSRTITYWNDPLGIDAPLLEPSLLRYGAGGLQTFWPSDPLPASSVSDLCIDSRGTVWVAGLWEDYTREDPYASYLCRWDGVEHEIFWPWHRELPNLINCVTPGPDGDVWFGTDEGLYVFDGEEWRQVNDASITKVKIAPDGQVWIIWCVSEYERRAQRFDGTRWWSAYRPDWSAQELSDVAFDSNGVAWFSCDDRFWDQYEDSTPRNYAGIRSLAAGEATAYATGAGYDAIAVDQNDVVWATCGWVTEIASGSVTTLLPSGLGGCGAEAPLFVDSQNRKWCQGMQYEADSYHYQPGLLRIDGDEQVRFYSTSDGLCSGEVNDIDEDQYGNMWVSTERGVSVLLADGCFYLKADAESDALKGRASLSYLGPPTSVDVYVAVQAPSGQIFYVAPRGAAPPFPIFYVAFDGSTAFLEPGPSYSGPGSIPNTPDMKDLAPPPLPLPDPPDGEGPTGLALFAYPVPYFANVPLPAYGSIDDLVLLNTTLPNEAPAGAYTFHIGLTGPFSIKNVYRTASCPFEVRDD